MRPDLDLLAEMLTRIFADLEQPSAELDAASAANRVDVTLYRAMVQVALVRWHARTALQYVSEMKSRCVDGHVVVDTGEAGSKPANGSSEDQIQSS